MEKINILITSAGRRVSLVKNFQEHFKVFTCDMNPFLSAACQISDGFFQVPPVVGDNYLDIVLEFCKKNHISMVVPTIDTELSTLAKAKEMFLKEGVLIVISSLEICETFYLKTSTEKFFKRYGFDTPKNITDLKTANYPLFAKLNNSSSSIGAMVVKNYEVAKSLKDGYVFQEYIKGTEYTIDIFFDKYSKIRCIVPRKRIEVRAGEVSKAKTIKDRQIIDEIKKLEPFLKGAHGCITVQLFKSDDKIYFIEINPRFGGGYPLSRLAGADYAKMILDEHIGKELQYFEEWRDGLIMLRYDAEVLVDGSGL